MTDLITFDDALLVPRFSEINSRKEVDISSQIGSQKLLLPVISSNMDTITGPSMANALAKFGAIGCLHRFQSIGNNLQQFYDSDPSTWVSIGISEQELERAEALYAIGASTFVIDVAWGASEQVVAQYKRLREHLGTAVTIGVGNFAEKESLSLFLKKTKNTVDFIKVGLGNGANCKTRLVTGVGYPQLSAVLECSKVAKKVGIKTVSDGGIKHIGDIAKALAAGADAVMMGRIFAGTMETPGDLVKQEDKLYKIYRGSASKESYEAQGKLATWRAPEGGCYLVPYKDSVVDILFEIEGGLRSSFSYLNAYNLTDFQKNAKFIKITPSTIVENGLHGRKE